MTLNLKPGTKVRPRVGALARYEGYISHDQSALPNSERVYFPDFDTTLTYGHDELDMFVPEGAKLTDLINGWPTDIAAPQPELLNAPKAIQQDPGDENDFFAQNDWAFEGEYVDDPWFDYTVDDSDGFVSQVNQHGNGFEAEVYVESKEEAPTLAHLVSFDMSHLWNGEIDDNESVGLLLTPEAAYLLAEKLMDAADIAEANA